MREQAKLLAYGVEEDIYEYLDIATIMANGFGRYYWDNENQIKAEAFVSYVSQIIDTYNILKISFFNQDYDQWSYDRDSGTLYENGNAIEKQKSWLDALVSVMNGEKEYAVTYNYDADLNLSKLRYLLPVYGNGGRMAGVLSVTLEHEELEKNMLREIYGVAVDSVILDSEGNIISSTDDSHHQPESRTLFSALEQEYNCPADSADSIRRLLREGEDGAVGVGSRGGEEYLLTLCRIEKTGWYVGILYENDVLAHTELYQLIGEQNMLLAAQILLLFLIVLLVVYLFHSMRKKTESHIGMLEKKVEDANLRMLSGQMQPHFLYNALASIREIVLDDPEYASDLIYDFSTYLRGSIMSITSQQMIPFGRELDHIRAYANIEIMRFGDRLKLIYDTEAADFLVPPLSIQPLVENAVRHGVFQNAGRGTVRISSAEREDCWEIRIEDDGCGFDVDSVLGEILEGSRDSYGLKNSMKRLREAVNAETDIRSTPGTGTVITIRIPKEKNGRN